MAWMLADEEKLAEGWKQVTSEASGDDLATAWTDWMSANLG